MNDEQRTNAFLATQGYMTLAVTLDDGTPWAVPVKFKLQGHNTFEWYSKLDTEHSKAIGKRPSIAISIFTPKSDTTEQFGFYAKADVKLIKETEGLGHYQAVVSEVWVNDDTFVKREVELE